MESGPNAAEPAWAGRLARTPFAVALAKGAPLFVAKGEPPHIVFANPAALAAFGAPDLRALDTALLVNDGLAAHRLRRLAAEMTEEAPPRLEMLRFFVVRKPVSVYWLCARLRREGEAFFVAADPSVLGDEAPTPSVLEPTKSDLATPSSRFLWRLDAEGRFGAPDSMLAARLGAHAPRQGETLGALSARAGLGPEWTQAVSALKTFTGLRLNWPDPGRESAQAARLSGAPQFTAGQRYEGFRGFGVFTGERIRLNGAPVARTPTASPARLPPMAGDAAALLNFLQRQHPAPLPLTSGVAADAATAPALAIISALAALLQPKAAPVAAKPAPPATPKIAEAPANSAEIVVLRPNAAPEAALSPRNGDSVTLSSQERDAFKEIARQLGVNVRGAKSEPEAPAAEPLEAEGSDADDLVALLDALPIAALLLRGGETLYANKTLLDLVGYRDLADFRAHDGVRAIFRGRDPQTLAPGGAVAGVPLVVAGERILTVDAQVRPAMWRGAPAQLIAMRRSREADHQAELRAVERETAMHAARARDLAAALDAARDGMVRLDRGGHVLGMNKGAEKLFGYDQKETAGESFLTLFTPDSQPAATRTLERLARSDGGPVEMLEAVARHQDGRQFPVRLEAGRLANQPEPDFFLLITDRSQSQAGSEESRAAIEAAEKASAAKTELLLRVSHEMRTPLHAILGFSEVILEERFGPIGNERYREYIRDIHASGRHVLSLAGDLLDLTKIELGKLELQFAPIDINGIVRECVTMMQPQAARERVIMRLSLYDRLPNVMVDERSLRQIMLNLMANAVKYNEPGGQVIVSTALDDSGSVILRVRDTGVGMNENELAIALEPFKRVAGAKAVEGTGIGLPLTKALVEANNADFSIKSRKDQGTLVEIAFPVQRAAQ